jgi:hypothetical protein
MDDKKKVEWTEVATQDGLNGVWHIYAPKEN